MLNTSKVIVLGGSGYIGKALCEALKADNYDIKNSSKQNILNNIVLGKSIKGHDTVFHLASPVIVQESFSKPYYYWKNIVEGTMNVINACLMFKCRLIFASTKLVEKHCNKCGRLLSPYAEAKCEAELLIQRIMSNYIIVRLPNIYDKEDKDPYRHRLVPKLVDMARKRGVIEIYPPVEDKIELLTLDKTVDVLKGCLGKQTGIYNISGEVITIGELAERIAKKFAARVIVKKDRS